MLGHGTIEITEDSHSIKADVQDEMYFPEYTTSLNFAISEVRELKLWTIEEIFEEHDLDRLEIDLMRFPRYFRAYLEYRSAVVLTDFLRTERKRLNERGTQRARQIKLAVRVGENLVVCRITLA